MHSETFDLTYTPQPIDSRQRMDDPSEWVSRQAERTA